MQYNIFKVKDKDNLLNEMIERNYRSIGHEIISSKYRLRLFYKYDNDLKLSWKNILIEFGAQNPPTRIGISGIIMCESAKNNYAITYGASSFLVQKYSDKEFGFNFAKRIELKEMKRKSSVIPHSTKNSSITSFKNTSEILFDSGENITSLSFTPQKEFYGKRIDIGKSIKLKVDISLNNINLLFDEIEKDMENNVINSIPLLTKITDQDEIEKYDNIMYDSLNKEYNLMDNLNTTDFSLNEFEIVGSSIYFEEDYTQILKVGKIEEEIELHGINDLFDFSKRYNIDIREIIEKGKIIYKDSSGEKIYHESLRKFITYELDSENVSLYNDEWYYYNSDYYSLVIDEIRSIDIEYDSTDNICMADIEKNRTNAKEYREEILNKMLSIKHGGKLMDRDLFISKYESDYFNSEYKIELADLIIRDEYISVKIGGSQSLSYCVDQCDLSARLFNAKKVDLNKYKLVEPQKYGVWFFLDSNTIFSDNNAKIEKINSIMLLSKLSIWSKNIKMYGKKPVIHVNKFTK